MTSAANQEAYGYRGWNQGPWESTQGPQWQQPNNGTNQTWGNPAWTAPPFWHPAGMSRPVAIAFTILGFMFWWPVGLAMLFYTIGSGRMGCMSRRAMKRAMNQDGSPFSNWKSWASGSSDRPAASSGNYAFDEYKAETLRRMEEEQKEFGSFLERLRFAKDKAEFDQFMAERRSRPPATEQPPA
jgi:hypothetical protein